MTMKVLDEIAYLGGEDVSRPRNIEEVGFAALDRSGQGSYHPHGQPGSLDRDTRSPIR